MKTKLPWYIQLWRYISPMWQGKDGQISIKRVLALIVIWDALRNTAFAIRKWDNVKSLSDAAMLLGLEYAFAAALLGLTSYFNWKERQLTAEKTDVLPPGGYE